jgi:predicted  nucleic acid-binding Zn-ribbon protein
MWQVSPDDEAKLLTELAALDAERYRLDRLIRDAVARKRYRSDPEQARRASDEEHSLVIEMDRLMTRIRGLEGRLLLLHPEGLTLRSQSQSLAAPNAPVSDINR